MDAVRLSWQLEDRGLIVDLDDDNRLVVLGGCWMSSGILVSSKRGVTRT